MVNSSMEFGLTDSKVADEVEHMFNDVELILEKVIR